MPDLYWLADLGRASVTALWLPVAIWSAVALAAEAALRLGRTRAALALPVRGAVLAALPLAVLVPAALALFAPEAVVAVTAVVPDVTWLPEVAVGGPAPVVEASGPPALDVWLGLAVLAVAVVAAYRLVEWLHALVAVARARRSFVTPGPDERAAVEAARQRLGVARPVTAAVAPTGTAPFTVGWRKPVVALPNGLDADAREVAAVHEVAHVRRGDFAWHAAQRVVTALFGAHPLVWVLGRGLDLDREHAADAVVLDACPDKRRAYADLLFSYATLPAPALALGAARGSSSLKSRIDAMTRPLSPTQSRRLGHLGRLAGFVALAVAVGGAASLVSPPSASASASGFSDPAVQAVGISYAGGETRVSVTLADGATPEAANEMVDRLRDTEGVPMLLTVRHDDGQTVRTVPLSPRSVLGASAPAGTFLEAFGLDSPEFEVSAVSIRDGSAGVVAGLRPGISTEHANRIADRIAGSYLVQRVSVSVRGGVTVERGTPRAPAATPSAPGDADRTVEGLVLDADSRDPVIGASVVVTGTTIGAATGPDGRYQVNDVPDGAQSVRVSAPGFNTRVVSLAADQTTLDVALTTRDADPAGIVRTEPSGAPRPEVFEVAEEQPQLIGGLEGLQERVVYPTTAREAGVEGQVVVQFIVNEEGAVEDAVVLRSPDDRLSEAALAAVRASEFTPGRQRGRAVKVRFAVPVSFRLPGGEDRGEVLRGPLPGPDEVDRRLPYAGTDLALLENERFVDRMMAHTLGILDQHEAEPGVTLVSYTMQPGGRVSNVRTAESSGSAPLDNLARGLVATFRFREDRSPPTPREGTFRLHYAAARQ